MTMLSAPWSDASQATALGDGVDLACALVFAGQIVAWGESPPGTRSCPSLLVQLATTFVVAAAAGPVGVEAQHFSGGGRLWLAMFYLCSSPRSSPSASRPGRRKTATGPRRAD